MINFVYILFILLIYGDYCFTETNGKSCNKRFVGVVDGGSSGTRLHLFEFNVKNLKELKKDNRFESDTPLSTFSNEQSNWSSMRIMLEKLTTDAKSKIPTECIAVTPIYVQLTAGVRQLGEIASKRILNEIRTVFHKATFKFQNNFVDLLSIEKEGRLAWISVNYLLKILGTDQSTVGMLDLGGGSTQIAFATTDNALDAQTVQMKLFGKVYNIYASGYAFFGLDEIRAKYLNIMSCDDSCCTGKVLTSTCIHPGVKTNFQFRNCKISIGGKSIENLKRFSECYNKGADLLKPIRTNIKRLQNMLVYAISGFTHVITSGMDIPKKCLTDKIEVTLFQIIHRSLESCRNVNLADKVEKYQHLLCLDMSYITSLFNEIYQLTFDQKILVSKKINKIKLSWALGYAISTF